MPKLYIDEFVGVSNRPETLPLAFAIRQHFGHDIILDWHELDSFSVDDTLRGKVRLARHLAERIRKFFAALDGSPLVGVHVRMGEYELGDETTYSIDRQWPAVPLWWFASTIDAIRRQQPETVFLLSSTGDPAVYRACFGDANVISLDSPSPYTYKLDDHRSKVNPVADLFALACCPIVLATPFSGYSHWAANVLGPAADCIVPVPGATQENPARAVVRLHGARLPKWRHCGRTGSDALPLGDGWADIRFDPPADTDWL